MTGSVASRLRALALAALALSGVAAGADGERRIQGVLAPALSSLNVNAPAWYTFQYGMPAKMQCMTSTAPAATQELIGMVYGVETLLIEQTDDSVVLQPLRWLRTDRARQAAMEVLDMRLFPTREACLKEAQWVAEKGDTCYVGFKTDYDGRAACRAMFKDMAPRECENVINDERRAGCMEMVENSIPGQRRSGDLGADGWYWFNSDFVVCMQTDSPLAMQDSILKKEGYKLPLLKAADGSVTFAPLKREQADGTSVEVRVRNAILFPTMEACQARMRREIRAAARLSPP